MNLLFFTFNVILSLFFFVIPLKSQHIVLENIKKRLNDEIYYSSFDYTSFHKKGHIIAQYVGEIWVGIESYKVVTSTKTIIVHNNISYVLDIDKKKLIISDYNLENDDFALYKIISADTDMYEVSIQDENDGFMVKMTSQDIFTFFKTIMLSIKNEYLLVKLNAYDRVGNSIAMFFDNEKYIPYDTNIYNLVDVHSDIKIIDLREKNEN